jgi:hypothetical protein
VGGVLLGGGALVGVAVARWLVAVVHWWVAVIPDRKDVRALGSPVAEVLVLHLPEANSLPARLV